MVKEFRIPNLIECTHVYLTLTFDDKGPATVWIAPTTYYRNEETFYRRAEGKRKASEEADES